jgi:hypothetical protein
LDGGWVQITLLFPSQKKQRFSFYQGFRPETTDPDIPYPAKVFFGEQEGTGYPA